VAGRAVLPGAAAMLRMRFLHVGAIRLELLSGKRRLVEPGFGTVSKLRIKA
jgi:hypothetical protein